MLLVTVTSFILIISTIAAGPSSEWKMDQKGPVVGALALRSVLDAFSETAESHKFRKYVRECIRTNTLISTNRAEWEIRDPIEMDREGNIVGINLYNQKLTNSAIGDLSKLPSTLRILVLTGSNLTTLNVAALPRGLRVLSLAHNRLSDLDMTKLPPALTSLLLNDNKLSSLDLTELPSTLRDLWLGQNALTTVGLNALPQSLRFISLEWNLLTEVDLTVVPRGVMNINLGMNHLEDAHFSTIPRDGRDTLVYGHGYQRPPKDTEIHQALLRWIKVQSPLSVGIANTK